VLRLASRTSRRPDRASRSTIGRCIGARSRRTARTRSRSREGSPARATGSPARCRAGCRGSSPRPTRPGADTTTRRARRRRRSRRGSDQPRSARLRNWSATGRARAPTPSAEAVARSGYRPAASSNCCWRSRIRSRPGRRPRRPERVRRHGALGASPPSIALPLSFSHNLIVSPRVSCGVPHRVAPTNRAHSSVG
jgi:hypothetical protein